jgi:hypothetical protein
MGDCLPGDPAAVRVENVRTKRIKSAPHRQVRISTSSSDSIFRAVSAQIEFGAAKGRDENAITLGEGRGALFASWVRTGAREQLVSLSGVMCDTITVSRSA